MALTGFSHLLSLGTLIPVCQFFDVREIEIQVFEMRCSEFRCWQLEGVLVKHSEDQRCKPDRTRLQAQLAPRQLWSHVLPALAPWLALVLGGEAGTREECSGGHTGL